MPQSSDSKIVQLEEGIDVVCPTCGVLVVNKAGSSRNHPASTCDSSTAMESASSILNPP